MLSSITRAHHQDKVKKELDSHIATPNGFSSLVLVGWLSVCFVFVLFFFSPPPPDKRTDSVVRTHLFLPWLYLVTALSGHCPVNWEIKQEATIPRPSDLSLNSLKRDLPLRRFQETPHRPSCHFSHLLTSEIWVSTCSGGWFSPANCCRWAVRLLPCSAEPLCSLRCHPLP